MKLAQQDAYILKHPDLSYLVTAGLIDQQNQTQTNLACIKTRKKRCSALKLF